MPSTARSLKGANYRRNPLAPSGDDGKHDRDSVSPGSLRSPGAMQIDSLRESGSPLPEALEGEALEGSVNANR